MKQSQKQNKAIKKRTKTIAKYVPPQMQRTQYICGEECANSILMLMKILTHLPG